MASFIHSSRPVFEETSLVTAAALCWPTSAEQSVIVPPVATLARVSSTPPVTTSMDNQISSPVTQLITTAITPAVTPVVTPTANTTVTQVVSSTPARCTTNIPRESFTEQHGLLQRDSRSYSAAVTQRAVTTWMRLGCANNLDVVCGYFCRLEQLVSYIHLAILIAYFLL